MVRFWPGWAVIPSKWRRTVLVVLYIAAIIAVFLGMNYAAAHGPQEIHDFLYYGPYVAEVYGILCVIAGCVRAGIWYTENPKLRRSHTEVQGGAVLGPVPDRVLWGTYLGIQFGAGVEGMRYYIMGYFSSVPIFPDRSVLFTLFGLLMIGSVLSLLDKSDEWFPTLQDKAIETRAEKAAEEGSSMTTGNTLSEIVTPVLSEKGP